MSCTSSRALRKTEEKENLAPSELLYDSRKRLTFPLDQSPPPSSVLQRFTRAFNLANENRSFRQRRHRPSAMNFQSASEPMRKTGKGSSRRDSSEEESIASSSKLKERRDVSVEDGKSRASRDMERLPPREGKRVAVDCWTNKASTARAQYEGTREKDSFSDRIRSSSSSLDPLKLIQQSLPRFLSDIATPASEDPAEATPPRGVTPLPKHFFSSSSPTSKSRSSTNKLDTKAKDNIWSRQEQKSVSLTPSPNSYHRTHRSNTDGIGPSQATISSTPRYRQSVQSFSPETRFKGREGNGGDLNHFDMEDDCSSSDFVYNRHSSPEWISAPRTEETSESRRGTGQDYARNSTWGRENYEAGVPDFDDRRHRFDQSYSDVSL
jgi:hypothetical protein